MKYVRLGSTGLRVSRICLGMMSYGSPEAYAWHLREDEAEPIVRRAVDAGVTFFDTADMYSTGMSEEITGRLLSRLFGRREDYVLATKVYFPMGPGPNDQGLSRKHIMAGIDDSLRRLGTDHVDLYQIHRFDYETPLAETMSALHDVVRAGKARYLGASSMYAWQFAKAQHLAAVNGWTAFSAMQNHYNLIYREEEREMIPLCVDQGVGVIPWSPLARGRLARTEPTVRTASDRLATMYDPQSEDDAKVIAALHQVATARGVPPAQAALSWLLSKQGVTSQIIGATKPHHIDDAIAATNLPLTQEETTTLEADYRPHPPLGHS
jgi:aryl-alcohol dehydrogenase-like predicted oxidoreductase